MDYPACKVSLFIGREFSRKADKELELEFYMKEVALVPAP
jgi:hypothetical protein